MLDVETSYYVPCRFNTCCAYFVSTTAPVTISLTIYIKEKKAHYCYRDYRVTIALKWTMDPRRTQMPTLPQTSDLGLPLSAARQFIWVRGTMMINDRQQQMQCCIREIQSVSYRGRAQANSLFL